MFVGEYSHSLDAKGRLFIPANLRDELGKSFYVTIHPDGCLSAYTMERWNLLNEKLNALSAMQQARLRGVFSNAARCELDAQGRILLPAKLRDYAGLTKNVAVIGAGASVEFWDADTWAEVNAAITTPEALKAAFEELGF